ncbi:MAG: sulfotransferase domain-containing protein [Fuerstiella sp.]
MSISRFVRSLRPVAGWWNAPLPNFLIAGASRSGTASLWNYLRRHPDVFMPDQKEVGFFDDDRFFELGIDAYRRRFSGWNGEAAIGEATPRYFTSGILRDSVGDYSYCPDDDSAARVADLIPDVKSILSLRDPVRRAFSQYQKRRVKGTELAVTFRQAIEEELDGRRLPQRDPRCLVYANQYSRHVQRWFRCFPSSQVKIIVFEAWTKDPTATYFDLCGFLNISVDYPVPEFAVHNSALTVARRHRSRKTVGLDIASLEEETYTDIWKVFQPDVIKLEQMLGYRVSEKWGQWCQA